MDTKLIAQISPLICELAPTIDVRQNDVGQISVTFEPTATQSQRDDVAALIAGFKLRRRRTPQSIYAQLSPIAFSAQQLQRTAKICLAALLADKPELAAQVASELSIVIDPNENDPDVLEDRRV